jgi:hypothetical protein
VFASVISGVVRNTDCGVGFGIETGFGVRIANTGSEHAYRSSDSMLLAAKLAVLACVLSEGFAEVLEVAHTLAVAPRRRILTYFCDPSNNARGEPSS